jgi:hypothetical protein
MAMGVQNYNMYLLNGSFLEVYLKDGQSVRGKLHSAYLDCILLYEGNNPSDPRFSLPAESQTILIIERRNVSHYRKLS